MPDVPITTEAQRKLRRQAKKVNDPFETRDPFSTDEQGAIRGPGGDRPVGVRRDRGLLSRVTETAGDVFGAVGGFAQRGATSAFESVTDPFREPTEAFRKTPVGEFTERSAASTFEAIDPDERLVRLGGAALSGLQAPAMEQVRALLQGRVPEDKIAQASRAFAETEGDLNQRINAFTDALDLAPGQQGLNELVVLAITDPLNALPGVGFASTGTRRGTGAAIRRAGQETIEQADEPFGMAVRGADGEAIVTRADEGFQTRGVPGGRSLDESEFSPLERQAAGEAAPSSSAEVSPTSPPQPPARVAENFAENIRLEKYPDDIAEELQDWATRNPDKVQTARRGTISDPQVRSDARTLVESMGGDFQKLQKRWKPGEAWNAQEITAIRGVLREKTERVMEAAAKARADNSDQNIAQLFMALQEQSRVQEIVHGVTAEAGRALRAFRQEVDEAFAPGAAPQLERLLRRLGIQKDDISKQAELLMALDTNDLVGINNLIRSMSKPKWDDYLLEVWYNAILSGPKTHLVNTISNAVNVMISPIEKLGAATVEQGLARIQGRAIERSFSEVPENVFGAVMGIDEGVRGAIYTLKNGISPTAASKYEFRPKAFRAKGSRPWVRKLTGGAGRTINAPSTFLEASDTFFYSINYRAELNTLARRQAIKEGLTGRELAERVVELKQTPTEDIIRAARDTAEYRLFRQEPGKIIQDLMSMRERFPLLRLVIPFVRTPTNLLKFGLERSPAGFFNPKLIRNIRAKDPEAADQIARAMIGSMGAAGIAVYFGNGRITGRTPEDAAERDRFYREGKLPYAVRVGDTWIQYQRLEPFNQTFGQVAAVVDAVQNNEDDDTVADLAFRAGATMGENFISQTFMSGISDFLNATTEPERYGKRYAERFLTSMIPFSALLRTGAQITDPVFRRPEDIQEAFQAGIPGLSQEASPILTAFGEEAQRPGAVWFPITFSAAKQTEIDAELARLDVEVGFAGNSIKGQKLTPEQQKEYQRVSGEMIYRSLERLVASPLYQSATPLQQEDALRDVTNDSRAYAREILAQQFASGVQPVEPEPTRRAQLTPMEESEPTRRAELTEVE